MSSASGACDCERFRAQIEDLLDQQIDQAETQVLLEHARTCSSCSSIREAEIHLRDKIRCCMQGASVQVPSELRLRIMVSIHKETLVRLRPIRPVVVENWGDNSTESG